MNSKIYNFLRWDTTIFEKICEKLYRKNTKLFGKNFEEFIKNSLGVILEKIAEESLRNFEIIR